MPKGVLCFMEWYKIEFEPFDYPLGKHYLGYYDNEFKLVSKMSATLFSQDAIIKSDKLKLFLNNKKYRLVKPKKIYDIMKYRY